MEYNIGLILFIIVFVILLILSARSSRSSEKIKFKIELIGSNGDVARSWISLGTVLKEGNSYSFLDDETKRRVKVRGTLIISRL